MTIPPSSKGWRRGRAPARPTPRAGIWRSAAGHREADQRRSVVTESRAEIAIPRLALALALGLVLAAAPARAHELGSGRVEVRPDGTGGLAVELQVDPEVALQRLQLAAGEVPSRHLAAEQVIAELARRRTALAATVALLADGAEVVLEPGDLAPLSSTGGRSEAALRLSTQLSSGGADLRVRWTLPAAVYAVVTHDVDGNETAVHWVEPGEPSPPLAIQPSTPPGSFRVVLTYLALGFTHILPRGLDHILFVLGIFLFGNRVRPVLAQVTAFTVAHSITLGLAIYGVVSLPPAAVEPLIALSIVYVAVENVLHPRLTPWRVAVVFGFGLLHGLGFAGVLGELGLPRSELLTALVGFNAGVELGQLAVIGLAFAAIASWARREPWYRRRVVVPASLAIAALGLLWTVERALA